MTQLRTKPSVRKRALLVALLLTVTPFSASAVSSGGVAAPLAPQTAAAQTTAPQTPLSAPQSTYTTTTAPAPATAVASPAITQPTLMQISVDHGIPIMLSGPATSVFIANPDIADVQVMSPTSIMLFGKRTGETTFMATDADGKALAERTVVVTQDLFPLRQELATAIPGNHIRVDALPNGLVLTGEAKDPSSVADAYKMALRYIPTGGDIINRIHVVGSNQIMIRVRFAEVQRSINNTLGFNWGDLASVGGFTFGVATGAISAITAGAGIVSQRPSNTSLSEPNDVIGASAVGNHYNVNAVIDALAQDGLITILAEPNLTAMSGETANFLAGGEFPVPIPQGLGNISIQFKDYGISLEFTPTLISDDRISLHVKPEVSELTDTGAIVLDNITVPALTTRKAETTVEVASGQSFAIAGLLDNNQTQTVNKFPVLGDLPVLGPLFRSSQFQNGQTELVVIITPYIVKPTKGQLALPTDGLVPPNETERLLQLRYSGEDQDHRPISGPPTASHSEPPSASAIIPIPMMPESALTPAGDRNMDAAAPSSMPTTAVTTVETSTTETVQTTPVQQVPLSATPMSSTPMSGAPMSASPIGGPAPAPLSTPSAAPVLKSPRVKPHPPTPAPAPIPDPAPLHESRENPTSLVPTGPGGFVLE